jgi:hypothetical protein
MSTRAVSTLASLASPAARCLTLVVLVASSGCGSAAPSGAGDAATSSTGRSSTDHGGASSSRASTTAGESSLRGSSGGGSSSSATRGGSTTGTLLPPAPTRDEILAVQLTFQGLSVTLPEYGSIPWFEVALTSLSASDRQLAYAAKHAAGDTHLLLSISWNYAGDGGYSYPVPGTDLTGNLPAFRALVEEAIENGFYVLVFLAGDGESNPSGGYNDPVGWTYGYSWLKQNLPAIVASLQQPVDLTPYVIFLPGFDGVAPGGWAPDASNPTSTTYAYPSELDDYLLQARALVGASGYLGVELEAGACDWGGGAGNYGSPAGQDLDIILQEFPGPPTGDQVWQIAGRELGPAYVRPPDEPAGDDPSPPWYLSAGTPRGPFVTVGFEYDEYRWVRGEVTAAVIATEQAYLTAAGYPRVD